MKTDVRTRSISAAAVVNVIMALASIGIANGQAPPAKDEVTKFKAFLESDGFEIREGAMAQYPMDERCCPETSILPCSFFNQASKYMVPFVPTYPGEPPYPSYTSYPGNPVTGTPPTDKWSASWRLRPDEALVMIGITPPPVRYFGLQSYLFFRYNPNMDRSLPCPPNCYPMQRLWNNFGDQTNQLTIHSAGTPNGEGRNPFNSLTVYIVTPDQGTDARVRAAARRAGYPPPIINTEPMPQSLLNLGVGETSDIFNLLFRAAFGLDKDADTALAAYKANPPWRVFRVTPKTPVPATSADPFPIPKFRAHGTGETEFHLLPAVEKLREAILDVHGSGVDVQEFTSYQGPCHHGLYGFENKVDDIGPSIDSLYLHTEKDLGTLGPNDYFIVYGVNHQQTGKAMYMNVTMYGTTKQCALNQVPDARLLGSAAQYLPAGYPDGDKLYAYKIARHCNGDVNCLEVPYGCPGMAANETAYIVWRNYLEKATKTGASPAEVVLDRAVKFSPAR